MEEISEFNQVFQISHLYTENETERFISDVHEIVGKISSLNYQQKETLFATLCKFKKLFSKKDEPGERYEHEIRLKNADAIVKKSYPVPIPNRPSVRGHKTSRYVKEKSP